MTTNQWPKMLIFGGTKGLGKTCAEFFSNQYQIITVARNGQPTFRGDVCDKEFMETVFNELPDPVVVINCVAVISVDEVETLETNFVAAAKIMSFYYKNMKCGHIINLGSNAAHNSGVIFEHIPMKKVLYASSKKHLKDFSYALADSQQNPFVKISVLEPEYMDTQMGGGNEQLKRELELTSSKYIASVIDWILQQPEDVSIQSIHIKNRRKVNADRK